MRFLPLVLALLIPPTPGIAQPASQVTPAEATCYIGTYTRGGKSKGIYHLKLDYKTGKMTLAGVTEGVKNPSFLALGGGKQGTDYLYCVSEVADTNGRPTGGVTAYRRDPGTGKLTKLNSASSKGRGPCHLTVDRAGKNVLVANYGAGSVTVIPIKEDGSLAEPSDTEQHKGSGPNKRRQAGPHAHSVNLDAANRFAFVADLGMDKVMVYRFNGKSGQIEPGKFPFAKLPPGGGPRHFSFHPSGKFAYSNNEMTSAVTAMTYNADTGKLTPIQTLSTLPRAGGPKNNSTAECLVHPNGQFVYVSNRGHNSIAIFKVDQKTGKLTAIGHESTRGEIPRNFGIDPTGRILIACNQNSGDIYSFFIDRISGLLKFTGNKIEVPRPVCVKFVITKYE